MIPRIHITRLHLMLFCLFCGSMQVHAGGGEITIRFTWQGEPVTLGEAYVLPGSGDTVVLETIRLYISDLQTYHAEEQTSGPAPAPFLMDAENGVSRTVSLMLPPGSQVDELRFTAGIDSSINVSGAMGGDLDPTKGMYWTWQSGYINFKIEGTSPSCDTRNHAFQYHLGGYRAPFAAAIPVRLPLKGTEVVIVDLELSEWFAATDLAGDPEVMSPGKASLALSKALGRAFKMSKL